MNNCMIIRIQTNKPDAEIANRDTYGNMQFKTIELKQLAKIINLQTSHFKNIRLCTDEIIGYGNNCVLIKQKGRKRVVMFSLNGQDAKAFKINYPNAFYIVHYKEDLITDIEMYSYKKYNGEETNLFEYPMPNELSGNKLCIGTAPRKIIDGDIIKALETIIFIPYSHRTFSGVKGFSDSEKWFKYLSKNEFPYKLLKPLNRKLKDVLED